jgi:hypothetical protein
MQLQLQEAERDLMVRILEHALGEMRVEVRRTRTPDFHDRLQLDEELLKGVIGKLQAGAEV